MNQHTDSELLRAYANDRSEAAFAELVRRHVDLVYSAALRMVRGADLAQDVTQGVFVALAKNTVQLSDRPVLSGWLHRTAQNIAAQTVRTEVRRRLREQEAAAMSELFSDQPEAVWAEVAPLLDDAMGELSEADRDAVMLRYFERKSAGEMAQLLNISEEAAQKRVSRAVERLREIFEKRGVAVAASALVLSISTNAVQAAPAGLAASISAAAIAGAVIATTTAATAVATIAMTTLQKAIVATAIAAVASVAIYQTRQVSVLRAQNQTLQKQLASGERQSQQEGDLTTPKRATSVVKKTPTEVSKLRAQVGALRQENAAIKNRSALSKVTADPDARKAMRDQQKLGMSMIYADLAKQLNLSEEAKGQFNDLLADHIMDSVDVITQALQDKATGAETDLLFAAQDSVLEEKVSSLLGQDGTAQYKTYTKNLLSSMTASQFSGNFTGDTETKANKRQQFLQALKEESQAALSAAGLPADYQTIPLLNFRNIASEETGERGVGLLETIYGRVAARANTFLTAEELTKFQEFAKTGVQQNRSALLMNRKMMAPISQ